jgi:hypothetical protein
MTKLLEKGAKFKWSPQCEEAFLTLKQLLTTAPVLVNLTSRSYWHDAPLPFKEKIGTVALGPGLAPSFPGRPMLSCAAHACRPLPFFHTALDTSRPVTVSALPRRCRTPSPVLLPSTSRSTRTPSSFLHVALPMPDPSPFPFSSCQKPPMPSVSLFRSTAVFSTDACQHPFLPSPQSPCISLERRSAAALAGFAPKHHRRFPPQ